MQYRTRHWLTAFRLKVFEELYALLDGIFWVRMRGINFSPMQYFWFSTGRNFSSAYHKCRSSCFNPSDDDPCHSSASLVLLAERLLLTAPLNLESPASTRWKWDCDCRERRLLRPIKWDSSSSRYESITPIGFFQATVYGTTHVPWEKLMYHYQRHIARAIWE